MAKRNNNSKYNRHQNRINQIQQNRPKVLKNNSTPPIYKKHKKINPLPKNPKSKEPSQKPKTKSNPTQTNPIPKTLASSKPSSEIT
jgi:hypothetical protein